MIIFIPMSQGGMLRIIFNLKLLLIKYVQHLF